MHRDIVLISNKSHEGLVNLGRSVKCETQGFYLPRRIFTVQAHPEFDDFVTSTIVKTRHEEHIFSDDVFEEAMSKASLEHDGVAVGRAICKFLLDSNVG
jgi:GMP synthase-like glutamine amidotransferase